MAATLLDFWMIIVFSMLGVLLATRLNLPSVIGVLIFGALIGPSGLGFVQGTDLINILSEFGAILLLFFIGLEFSIEKLMKCGVRAALIFTVKTGFVFIIAYVVALLMDFTIFESILIGAILSFTSTAIFARFINDMDAKDKEEARVMTAVLIMEDIAAIFLITILSQMKGVNTVSLNSVILPAAVSLCVLTFTYIVLRSLVRAFINTWVKAENIETVLFTALSLCALFASLAAFFGMTPSIGAFLAGSIFASTNVFKKTEHALLEFILVFSAFFFFSIGMLVNPIAILNIWPVILIFFIVAVLSKFTVVSFSSYVFGMDSKAAVFSGLMMLTVSEFALLIARQATVLSSFDFITFSASLVFLTALFSAIMYKREHRLDSAINEYAPDDMKKKMGALSNYLDVVLKSFEPGGFFFKNAEPELKSLTFFGALLIFINTAVYVTAQLFTAYVPFLIFRLGPVDAFTALAIVLSLYPLLRVLLAAKVLLVEFPNAFHLAHRNYSDVTTRAILDLALFFIMFATAVAIPLLLSLLGLPNITQLIAIVPALMSLAFIMDLARVLQKAFVPSKPQHEFKGGYLGLQFIK
ncbi:MAG: cation:proton antiporter [Candidatus Micrarchaeota archaeon]